jgi:hypothetical protein
MIAQSEFRLLLNDEDCIVLSFVFEENKYDLEKIKPAKYLTAT